MPEQHMGEWLALLITRSGRTKGAIAARAGIRANTVSSAIAHGRSRPETWAKLGHALGIGTTAEQVYAAYDRWRATGDLARPVSSQRATRIVADLIDLIDDRIERRLAPRHNRAA